MDDLIEIVNEYLSESNTNCAILINGKWGSGKTYFWKNRIENQIRSENKLKPLYISLYGLDTLDKIDSEIISAYFPKTSGNPIKAIWRNFKKFIGGIYTKNPTLPFLIQSQTILSNPE